MTFSRTYALDASPKTLITVPSDGVMVVKALLIHNTGASETTVSFLDGDSTTIIGDITVAAGSVEKIDVDVLGGSGVDVLDSLQATSTVADGSVKVTVVFDFK